jgi:cobalamin biosynthesis Co2+ chelatase CbiK
MPEKAISFFQTNMGHLFTLAVLLVSGGISYGTLNATVAAQATATANALARIEATQAFTSSKVAEIHDKQIRDQVETEMRLKALEAKINQIH